MKEQQCEECVNYEVYGKCELQKIQLTQLAFGIENIAKNCLDYKKRSD